MHCVQAVWLDSYFPAGHAVHVVFAALTYQPAPQVVQATTVPVVEYLPAPHVLFDVFELDAGHSDPPGHAVHVALVDVPVAL